MFGDKFTMIVALIAGLAIGGLIGWLATSLSFKLEIAELEKERDRALLERATMQDQWEQAVNELNSTKVLLNDTLAALELLRQYQAIDNETRNEINRIENTLDPQGNPTEDTYNQFRKLIDEMNKQNQEYNTGSLASAESIDITPFVELRREAEQLFNKATELLLQYKE